MKQANCHNFWPKKLQNLHQLVLNSGDFRLIFRLTYRIDSFYRGSNQQFFLTCGDIFIGIIADFVSCIETPKDKISKIAYEFDFLRRSNSIFTIFTGWIFIHQGSNQSTVFFRKSTVV